MPTIPAQAAQIISDVINRVPCSFKAIPTNTVNDFAEVPRNNKGKTAKEKRQTGAPPILGSGFPSGQDRRTGVEPVESIACAIIQPVHTQTGLKDPDARSPWGMPAPCETERRRSKASVVQRPCAINTRVPTVEARN